ncbi:MAG: DUF5979 domain-containing protein, partial [Actinomycetes bacterium]
ALVDGTLTFSAADHHIPWGYTYYLYEATPPTGYDVMTPNPAVIDGTSPDVAGTTVTVDETDPRLLTGLRILKTDDFGAPVEGAVFQLYLDDGDGTFEPCGTEACTGDTSVGGTKVSGTDGVVEWTGLTWGLRYWVHEVSAPAGYELMDPRQVLVEIPESAAGGVHDVTGSLSLVDPRVRGGFTITKVADGLPDGEEPAFSVYVDCGSAYFQGTVDLLAPTYSAAVTDVPVGEECSITEPTVPDGWAFVSIDNPTVTVVEDDEQQVDVTVTNERLYDSFDLRKVIEGAQVQGEDAGFTVLVDCASADPGADDYDQNVVLSTPSLTGSTGDIPVGLECTFTETGWDTGRYAPVDVAPSSATVGDGTVGEIVVTNERLQGTLTVEKTVENPVPGETDTFPVTVDCSNGHSQTFDLAHGESASIEPQPVGVTCTVTEGEIDTTRYVEVSDAEQQGTVRVDGQTETVTVENERLYGGFDVVKDPQGLLPGEQASFDVLVECAVAEWTRSFRLTLGNGNGFEGSVDGVPTGALCTVTEPVVPDGWALEGVTPVTVTVVADAEQQVDVTVTNERVQGELTVLKTDEAEEPLAGATFALWQSTDDVIGDEGDTVVGTCTTGDDGTCTIGGLDWGLFYFWQETQAPEGYNLPTVDVQGPIELTAGNVGGELPLTTFVDLRTQIVTTPFVGDEAVTQDNIAENLARVDENDVVRDRAVVSNLSEPATGTVTFELYGPYYDATLNGMDFSDPDCEGEPVFVSADRPITRVGEGTYEAYSEELAVGGEDGLEPGLYQWVAEFVPAEDDVRNVGVRGLCPDPTEMFVVRAGDEPGLDKDSDPVPGSLVQPGQEIAYTIMVSNSGDMPIPADEAVVTDVLDPWLAYVDGSGTPEPAAVEVDESTGETTIVWELGELASGSAVAIGYTAVVVGDVPQNEALDNVARFLDLEDSTVHVVPNGDLTIVKEVDPESGTGVIPGETLTYTMTVTATGELDQTDVLVSDFVPGYDPDNPESLRTTYVIGSADCDDLGECVVVEPGGDGEIVWSLGDMPAGSSRTVTFQVTVDQVVVTGEGTVDVGDVVNGAWVSSNETDWTPSNEVVNPVAVVLGIKIPNEPEEPTKKEPARVLGTKLPRTGSPIGAAAWLAGALLVLGAGLRAAGSKRRAERRA